MRPGFAERLPLAVTARSPFLRDLDLGSKPPALHKLQTDASTQQSGIGRVVPESARSQVKLVDEWRALVEDIDNPEIGLRIGERAFDGAIRA